MRVLAVLLAIFALQGSARAGARDDTLATLEAMRGGWSGAGLAARVNEGEGNDIRLGERIRFHFESAQDAWLFVVHVDSHGVGTVLFPDGMQIRSGAPMSFPAADDLLLEAVPPLGKEVVYVVASRSPLTAGDLGLADMRGPTVFEAADTVDLARRLADAVAARPARDVAIVRIDQRIIGRDEGEYTSADIRGYFTTRTRSLQRPALDLHLHFESGASELTPKALRSLDALGRALASPDLAEWRFVIEGHTDEVGDADYNLVLSNRRAVAAKTYLINEHGIAAARLETLGRGESRPLDPGTSDEARAANRRVVIELDQ